MKFSYLTDLHFKVENGTKTQSHYLAEVGSEFEQGKTFYSNLYKFDLMMKGSVIKLTSWTLFGRHCYCRNKKMDRLNALKEQLRKYRAYIDGLDYFVCYMFTLEKEAISPWLKKLPITGDTKNIDVVSETFKNYVTEQWMLYNKNGCGPLQTKKLSNYWQKPYHSTDQQQVKINVQMATNLPPNNITCSE